MNKKGFLTWPNKRPVQIGGQQTNEQVGGDREIKRVLDVKQVAVVVVCVRLRVARSDGPGQHYTQSNQRKESRPV